MGTGRSRTSDDHLHPRQRRRAIIQILAAGLARLHDSEKSPENPRISRKSPWHVRADEALCARWLTVRPSRRIVWDETWTRRLPPCAG